MCVIFLLPAQAVNAQILHPIYGFLYVLSSAVQMRIDLKGLRAVRHITEEEHII